MWSSLFVEVEDLEKKKDKEPVKLVDMENEEINKTSSRLFDEAFISTNEEVQVRETSICCQIIHNVFPQTTEQGFEDILWSCSIIRRKETWGMGLYHPHNNCIGRTKLLNSIIEVKQSLPFQIVDFLAKVVNPIIIVAFVVIYWVVGLVQYTNPSF